MPYFQLLIQDQYANYVVQKMIDVAESSQVSEITSSVSTHWILIILLDFFYQMLAFLLIIFSLDSICFFSLQALKLPTPALLKINEDPSPEDELW